MHWVWLLLPAGLDVSAGHGTAAKPEGQKEFAGHIWQLIDVALVADPKYPAGHRQSE
jgi:hypothetical protein